MSATSVMPEPARRKPGLVGPTILIAMGVVFLLNNLGVLSWGIWGTLLPLWPILLIALGLDLLFGRRSALGSLLVAVLVLGAIGAAIWFSGAWASDGTILTGETIAQPLGGATRADIAIEMGAGALRVGSLANSSDLLTGTLAHDARARIAHDFSVSGGSASYRLRSLGPALWALPFGQQQSTNLRWELRINDSIPINLDIATGAGNATLDFSQLKLEHLHIASGLGAATLTLPSSGRLSAQINGGVGQATITIPAGMAARITATTGIGQVRVVGNFERQDGGYRSPDYDEATNRIDLTVNGGIGSITIQQESGR